MKWDKIQWIIKVEKMSVKDIIMRSMHIMGKINSDNSVWTFDGCKSNKIGSFC